MENRRLWSRVTRWFRNEGNPARRRTEAGAPGDPVGVLLTARSGDRARTDGTGRATSARAAGASWTDAPDPGSTPDRLANLTGALEAHWRVQDKHLDTVNRAADRLVTMVESGVRVLEQHAAALTRITDSTTVSSAGIQRLEEKVTPLPAVADAQRETMVSIARRLEEWRGAAEETTRAVQDIRQALIDLAEAAARSMQTLQQMRETDASRERHIAALVQEQTRRLTTFGWWAVGLALMAAAVGLIVLFR